MEKALIAYVPVLHEGYLKLFRAHGGALYLVGPDLVAGDLPRLPRDLRAVPVEEMCNAIGALGLFDTVDALTDDILQQLNAQKAQVTMPTDEISGVIAEKLPDCTIVLEQVFLRWDKPITLAETEVHPDRIVSVAKQDRAFMSQAAEVADKSGDWWRQVGAVAVRDGDVLFTGYNAHHPSEHAVFTDGNPRDNFDAGEAPDISPTIHGEASIVAQAAAAGVSLVGSSVYVTTFPCINCARLLAKAGVKKIYYRDGYSRQDAEQELKDAGVEIVLVRD